VYIQDELANRLQRFRAELNLSEIAKAAIEERLRMEEIAADGDVAAQVLNRLRRGDMESVNMRARGADAGRTWAKDAASWDEIKQVAQWPEIQSSYQVVPPKPGAMIGALGATLAVMAISKSAVPAERCFVPMSVRFAPPPGTREDKVVMFWSGFADSVRDVYERIKDQMEPKP
jgi:hypothetical protein